MPTEAYVIRYSENGLPFRSQFLASAEYDVSMLQMICRRFGLHTSGNRIEILDRIERELGDRQNVRDFLIELLVQSPKKFMAIKTGQVARRPILANASVLVGTAGKEQWYGPVAVTSDPEAVWYMRSLLIPHWERSEGALFPSQFQIRWMCYARVTESVVSLHWNGFSWANEEQIAERAVQFDYWSQVPGFYKEIEQLLDAKVHTPNLDKLVLHKMWNQYRYTADYKWVDERIRAQSGGVAVSAHSGAVADIDVGGLRGFARVLRNNVEYELEKGFSVKLPEPERFDEVILRTLIREYGTRSYQFRLTAPSGDDLLRLHVYFGALAEAPSVDSLPHFNVFSSSRKDLDQLRFLLAHVGPEDHDTSSSR